MILRNRDYVFPAIMSEPAQSVEVNQVAGRQLVLQDVLVAAGPSHLNTREVGFHGLASVALDIQRAASIGDNSPVNGLKQEAVFIGYLLRDSAKDLASPFRRVHLNASRNQLHDLFL